MGLCLFFLYVLGLWEWGCVGNTVGRLALVLELWSDGMVYIVFHRVGVKVARLGLSPRCFRWVGGSGRGALGGLVCRLVLGRRPSESRDWRALPFHSAHRTVAA